MSKAVAGGLPAGTVVVYLLSAGSHSDWTILGIYSTRELAEAAKAEYERVRTVDWQDEPFRSTANPIQEIPLDEKWDKFEWEYR